MDICEGECMGHSLGDKPLILRICHICKLPWLHKALEEWKSVCGQAYIIKGINGKISFFCFLFCFASLHSPLPGGSTSFLHTPS